MAHAPLLAFRDEVSLVEASGDAVRLEFPWGKVTLSNCESGLRAALLSLAKGGATEDDISTLVLEADGAAGLAPLYYHLQEWGKLALLCYTLTIEGRPLATLVPMAHGFHFSVKNISADTRFRLSRFAYCRREGEALVLESPMSPARLLLLSPTGAALVAALARPRTYLDLCASHEDLTEETAQAFLGLLDNSRVIAEVGEDGRLPEDDNRTLEQWEFHDLLFHSRSRMGLHDYPFGAALPMSALFPLGNNL
jgi:oxazoline/thiazoline dehydrogenase